MTSTPSKEKETSAAPVVDAKETKPEPAPPVLSVEDGELAPIWPS